MARRFFTADFHLGMSKILEYSHRPFKTVEKMNAALVRSCNERAKEEDIIIHVGDFCQYGDDRGVEGMKVNPAEYIKQIKPTFVNLQGNHDLNNKTPCLCKSMRTSLGKLFPDVSVSHYPSYDSRAAGTFKVGDIHVHGHRHSGKVITIDEEHRVLNLNVGVDLWNYKIVSEQELIEYLLKFLRTNDFFKKFRVKNIG